MPQAGLDKGRATNKSRLILDLDFKFSAAVLHSGKFSSGFQLF